MDREHSHLTGSKLAIARTETGYRFDFGAAKFDIGDDGKFYPTISGRMTSLRATGERQWERIHRDKGVDVDHSILRLSPDERELVIDTESVSVTGVSQRSRDVEKRVGDGHGLAGTWQSTTKGINVSGTLILTDIGKGRLLWGTPEDGNYFVVTPDGSASVSQGPRAVASVKLAVRTSSPVQMQWTETIDGKPFMEGTDTLQTDGSLVETTWTDQSPADKQIAVYVRHRPR